MSHTEAELERIFKHHQHLKTHPTWRESVLAAQGLQLCPECGSPAPLGSLHCKVRDWKWFKIVAPEEKLAAKAARAAWDRAARINAIPRPEEMQKINKFYLACPEGCRVVHVEGNQHTLENLKYE